MKYILLVEDDLSLISGLSFCSEKKRDMDWILHTPKVKRMRYGRMENTI